MLKNSINTGDLPSEMIEAGVIVLETLLKAGAPYRDWPEQIHKAMRPHDPLLRELVEAWDDMTQPKDTERQEFIVDISLSDAAKIAASRSTAPAPALDLYGPCADWFVVENGEASPREPGEPSQIAAPAPEDAVMAAYDKAKRKVLAPAPTYAGPCVEEADYDGIVVMGDEPDEAVAIPRDIWLKAGCPEPGTPVHDALLAALSTPRDALVSALIDWRNCWLCPATDFEGEVERLLAVTDAALATPKGDR